MKDILVVLCCIGLMVNNKFIFITVCQSVYVWVLHFLLWQLLWTFEILCQLPDWAGGDYSSVWDIVLLGCVWLCSWLNESGRLCCCEFLYSSKKEEEEVVHWGGKKKIRYLLSAPLPGEKQWQLIPEGTSLSSACQHRQTTSFSTSFSHRGEKKKNQPSTNGSKPFPLKTVMLYLRLCLCNLYHTVFMEAWFLVLPNA